MGPSRKKGGFVEKQDNDNDKEEEEDNDKEEFCGHNLSIRFK